MDLADRDVVVLALAREVGNSGCSVAPLNRRDEGGHDLGRSTRHRITSFTVLELDNTDVIAECP